MERLEKNGKNAMRSVAENQDLERMTNVYALMTKEIPITNER